MRLLRAGARPHVVALALLVAAVSSVPSAAHPPDAPDHGVDAETFYRLWSGDADDADAAELEEIAEEPSSEIRGLALATDIPLDSPHVAVERWNRGEHGEFPNTDRDRSIHPPDAALRDGAFVKDAYAAIFAIQPATRALVSTANQPLYVHPSGHLFGTVDYRVEVPRGSSGPNQTVNWRLLNHGISETRVLVDDRTVTSTPGSHTPVLDYTVRHDGSSRTLTLEADIEVSIRRVIWTCEQHENNTTVCIDWRLDVSDHAETITVSESVEVVPYTLSVTGSVARYPDGDLGIALYHSKPWLGYALPGGSVKGVWRFYSARDVRWDHLQTSTETGTTRRHSPMHPLRVYAYPFEPGPTASPRDTVSILQSYGLVTEPPTLPSEVNLDVIDEPYIASYGLVTRTDGSVSDDWEVVATGLVRGVTVVETPDGLDEVPIHETKLDIDIVDSTAEHITVELRLTDVETGGPIETEGRRDYVILDGQRVETGAAGTVTRTIPRPAGALTARFVPGPWWLAPTGYVGDSDVVYVRGTVIHALAVLYEVGVPIGLFLFGAFVIDRITGWRLWPPWRRL